MNRPNVILIITDDQGYGDLGCTGNPWLQTPHIDRLHDEGVRLRDFHVQPLCTPTRGAIMSGKRPAANGAWATCWGRSLLSADCPTMADHFAAGGYRTGLFGKWHLGDNHPFRPFDRGFQTVVAHKGGGVGQTPDAWGNNYFDDTYFHNGDAVAHEGYCTDIWFDEAKDFLSQDNTPFLACIATNAPHSPYLVADRYAEPYRNNPDIPESEFFGMIANIDENVGALRKFVSDQGLTDNTLVIFMTDNGSSAGCNLDQDGFVTKGYNAGMRGKKGSFHDGGHRVPSFWYWPAGGLTGGVDRDELSADVDLLPTFVDLCGLPKLTEDLDGQSLRPVLSGDVLPNEPIHFLHSSQRSEPPPMWHGAVLTRRWRLLGGEQLFDIQADPGQRTDLADSYPEVLADLRAAYADWHGSVAPVMDQPLAFSLGHQAENPCQLDSMDVHGDVAWQQTHVAMAKASSGRWWVRFHQSGTYRFDLRRWPAELDLPIDAGLSPDAMGELCHSKPHHQAQTINPTTAHLNIDGASHTIAVTSGDSAASVTLPITANGNDQFLDAWFGDDGDDRLGAWYLVVTHLDAD